jgi:hypothetical protein
MISGILISTFIPFIHSTLLHHSGDLVVAKTDKNLCPLALMEEHRTHRVLYDT